LNARRILDRFWLGLAVAAVVVALAPLGSIIYYVTVRGIAAISWSFLTHNFNQIGNNGGIANALEGTFLVVALASTIGIPVGLLAGVYVSEYATGRSADVIRFLSDVLVGVPSIVTGILVYSAVVISFPTPYNGYTAFAAGIALGLMEIPIIANTTSESLRLVPNSLREASVALGIRKWRTIFLMLANCLGGIMTGILLATSRVAGETAPLLLTALGSTQPFQGLFNSVETMTLFIFQNGTSGTPNLVEQAWGASFVLLVTVLGINIAIKLVTRRRIVFV